MTTNARPMTDEEKARFNLLNKENLEFLMDRYNGVNRWVIADMVRRTAYHYPDKTAVIFGDISLTYAELEAACNCTANALAGLGVQKYDRVAILAHNTLHHVLTWLGWAAALAIAALVADRLFLAAEARGWIFYRRTRGFRGRAMYHAQELDSIFNPGMALLGIHDRSRLWLAIAVTQDDLVAALVLIIGLLAFLGSVTIARYVEERGP